MSYCFLIENWGVFCLELILGIIDDRCMKFGEIVGNIL